MENESWRLQEKAAPLTQPQRAPKGSPWTVWLLPNHKQPCHCHTRCTMPLRSMNYISDWKNNTNLPTDSFLLGSIEFLSGPEPHAFIGYIKMLGTMQCVKKWHDPKVEMWISRLISYILSYVLRGGVTSDLKSGVLSMTWCTWTKVLIINQISWDFGSSDKFGD